MSRRATRPLDPQATRAADDELYSRHESDPRPNALYDADGNRQPLDATDPDQAALRTEWMDLYEANGGEVEGSPPSDRETGGSEEPCPHATPSQLVSLTVRNATQTNVTGAKNWAAVKSSTDDVIVEATTTPNNEETWRQITWSGNSGSAVTGHPNQRRLSRSTSTRYHVEAALGGVTDHVDVWILWATVTNHTSGTTPANAVQYGSRYDGTETLGARSYDSGNSAVGKVVPVATITPAGVHSVVRAGWTFERQKMRRDFQDGAQDTSRWDTSWQPDTSHASFQRLTPDNDDKIYDRDAPNIADFGVTDSYERSDNFRQWVEWNGDRCSDHAGWYWRARWKRDQTPQVTHKELSTGAISPLPGPTDNHYSAP
jgi:hypothetical protein